MQNGPSQVSSGNIAPKIVGPQKEMKEVVIVSGLVLFLGSVLATAWYYGQTSDRIAATPATESMGTITVPGIVKQASDLSEANAATAKSTSVSTPMVTPLDDVIHADIYFEVGRKGLTDDAKAQLAARAELLKRNEDYGVLIQGYTDQQGSSTYNKKLGINRAEAVKTELVDAGVAEHRMKVLSLGEEGVLCVDNSDICRHVNRRVHLEIRRFGQEHMIVPATANSTNPDASGTDASTKGQDTGLSNKDIQPLNPEPIPGS